MKPWERFQEPQGPWTKFASDLNETAARDFGPAPTIPVPISGNMASPNIPSAGLGAPVDPLTRLAAETSPSQAALIGAGRTADKINVGAQELYLTPFAFAGDEDAKAKRDAIRADQAEKDRLYKPLSERHRVATTAGEMIPYAAAPLRVPGIPQSAANIIMPGVMGFAEYGTPGERIERAGMAAAGGAIASGLARGIGGRPPPSNMDPYLVDTIKKGQKLGFRALPSTVRGSRSMQAKEARMASNPRTADTFSSLGEHNNRLLARIAGKSIGLDDVDRLTPGQLSSAKSAIQKEFQNTASGKTVKLDPEFSQDVASIASQYSEGVGRRSKKIQNAVDDLLAKGPEITPEEYLRQTSTLAEDARSALTKDGGKSRALYDLRAALDRAFDRSTSASDKVRDARDKWRSLLWLQDSVTEDGNVSFRRLTNKIRKGDKEGYIFGRRESDLYDAVRFLNVFPNEFGNSGTAQRLGGKSIAAEVRDSAISGAGLAALLSGGMVDPVTGAAIGAGYGLTRPAQQKIAAGLYMSPALNRGLLPMSEKAQGLLGESLTRAITPGLLSIPQFE